MVYAITKPENFMMNEMNVGDGVLFYHSNAKPPGAIGIAKVSRLAQPDPTARDKKSKYFDPKSTEDKPIWHCVEVQFVKKLKRLVSLSEIKEELKLQDMKLLSHSRLSIQPLTQAEFEYICQMSEEPPTVTAKQGSRGSQ